MLEALEKGRVIFVYSKLQCGELFEMQGKCICGVDMVQHSQATLLYITDSIQQPELSCGQYADWDVLSKTVSTTALSFCAASGCTVVVEQCSCKQHVYENSHITQRSLQCCNSGWLLTSMHSSCTNTRSSYKFMSVYYAGQKAVRGQSDITWECLFPC